MNKPFLVSGGAVAGGAAVDSWTDIKTAAVQVITACIIYFITLQIERIRKGIADRKKKNETYKP